MDLKFSGNGTFKIVQFTDTHLRCWEHPFWKPPDTDPDAPAERAAKMGTELIDEMQAILDFEKPDLVIFTGDNVLEADEHTLVLWNKLTQPMTSRGIPWAAVLGNHDFECTKKTNRELMVMLETLPGSLAIRGEEALGGGGNYVLSIQASRSAQPAAAVFCIDSGDYADKTLSEGYAWFSDSHIAWFRRQARILTETNGGVPLPSLAFYHIPVPEYIDVLKSGPIYGSQLEDVCAPRVNSGMFSAFVESRSVMGTFVGHDHTNDYAGYSHGICLAYGRKTGTFCYQGTASTGGRVIEMQEGKRTFSTWIRTAGLEEENRIQVPECFIKNATTDF